MAPLFVENVTSQLATLKQQSRRCNIGNGVTLETVKQFCYLGDTIDAAVGSDQAITARIRSGWYKFRSMACVLLVKGYFSGHERQSV